MIVLCAALAAALGTARLGWWQLDRAQQKTALQRSLDHRIGLPPLREAALATRASDAGGQHHRRVELSGRWLPDATVYLDNRPMDGHGGFVVVTPLALRDGDAVLVQRGWLPRDPRDRTHVRAPELPGGDVVVQGRVAPPPARTFEIAAEGNGPIRQNLDLAAFERELRMPLRPLSVLQEGPSEPGAPQRRWPQPSADVHKHYGYAVQWFGLSALVIGLYVWFQLLRPRRQAAR